MSYTTIAFLVIMLLSAVIGAVRGFLKTLFSLLSSVGAVALAVFVSPYLSTMLQEQEAVASALGNFAPAICYAASFLIILIVAVLILKIIFALLQRAMQDAPVLTGVNRFLGVVINLVLGFFVCLVITYLISIFSSAEFAQTVIEDAHRDPLGTWLFDSNPIAKLMESLAASNETFAKFLEMLKSMGKPAEEKAALLFA